MFGSHVDVKIVLCFKTHGGSSYYTPFWTLELGAWGRFFLSRRCIFSLFRFTRIHLCFLFWRFIIWEGHNFFLIQGISNPIIVVSCVFYDSCVSHDNCVREHVCVRRGGGVAFLSISQQIERS